jgi:hypothetical protein
LLCYSDTQFSPLALAGGSNHQPGLFISITTSRSRINTSINTYSDDTSPPPAVSFEQINNERKNTRRIMSDKQTYDENHSQPQRYEIRFKGHLDDRWVDWFEGLAITLEENGNTLLSGPVTDQAALHGLLKKVRDVGLPLLSVNSVGLDSEEVRET